MEGNDKGIYKNTSATDLINEYALLVNYSKNDVIQLNNILEKVIKSDQSLLEESQSKLICGIFQFYMSISGSSYDKDLFKRQMGFSVSTLNNIVKKISNLYTS